jgi:WASH complex subunit 7
MSDSADFLIDTQNDKKSLETFRNDVFVKLKENAIKPICESVETNLRLQVHSHLRQDQNMNNPFLSTEVKNNVPF